MPAPLSHEKGGNPMAQPTQSVTVDKDLRPAYYDDFHCLAESCKISCCKGWSITFSKKDYLALKRQEGSPELNTCLAEGVRRIRRKSDDDRQLQHVRNAGAGAFPRAKLSEIRERCVIIPCDEFSCPIKFTNRDTINWTFRGKNAVCWWLGWQGSGRHIKALSLKSSKLVVNSA